MMSPRQHPYETQRRKWKMMEPGCVFLISCLHLLVLWHVPACLLGRSPHKSDLVFLSYLLLQCSAVDLGAYGGVAPPGITERGRGKKGQESNDAAVNYHVRVASDQSESLLATHYLTLGQSLTSGLQADRDRPNVLI